MVNNIRLEGILGGNNVESNINGDNSSSKMGKGWKKVKKGFTYLMLPILIGMGANAHIDKNKGFEFGPKSVQAGELVASNYSGHHYNSSGAYASENTPVIGFGTAITKENYIPGLPNGFKNSSPAIQDAWTFRYNREIVLGLLGMSSNTAPPYTATKDDYQNDPGTYLILSLIASTNLATNPNYGNLPQNDPMALWAKAIGGYTDCYIFNNGQNASSYSLDWKKQNIEKPLLQTLFACAGRPISDVDSYMQMSFNEKTSFMSGIRNEIMQASKRNQRIAEWAGKKLADYHLEEHKTKGDDNYNLMFMYNSEIEKPLREVVGKIRADKGGPYFYNLKLKI